jgi:hypothetical protein
MSNAEEDPTVSVSNTTQAGAAAAASIRRPSQALNTGSPTRTVRLTEAEQAARERSCTPAAVSLESLSLRPRSNQRTRTPMRFESPLTNEFRRDSLAESPPTSPLVHEARRITIRPLAGAAVGTVFPVSVSEGRSVTPRSSKQGPSHRKIRRWNNDHFEGLAAEIASSGSTVVAEALLKAHRDSHLYRAVYDPADRQRSEKISRYVLNLSRSACYAVASLPSCSIVSDSWRLTI